MSRRRVRAVLVKELREFRHNGNIIYAMGVLPLIFVIQPTIAAFSISSEAAQSLRRQHSMIYMLAIPVLIPAALSAYSVVGERLQGTLEPILSTPVRREELLLGKALAAFVPSVSVAYLVFGIFVLIVELFAHRGVASALIRGPDVVAHLVFTPLLAIWSIWVGIAISARSSDPRTAAQLAVLVSLPTVAITSLIAFGVIPASRTVALGFGIGLVVLARVGARVASALFDRERLITGTRT